MMAHGLSLPGISPCMPGKTASQDIRDKTTKERGMCYFPALPRSFAVNPPQIFTPSIIKRQDAMLMIHEVNKKSPNRHYHNTLYLQNIFSKYSQTLLYPNISGYLSYTKQINKPYFHHLYVSNVMHPSIIFFLYLQNFEKLFILGIQVYI